ncbi:hypothetical protein CC86DRAFT_257156, partial [Ophiobolus disseminans]
YTCLSYTWQPAFPQHTIVMNGRSLSVDENLYQFLRAYRNHQSRELPHPHIVQIHALWIDALRINQIDGEEKGHQIRHMEEIHQNATRVLVWLGVLDCAAKRLLAEIHVVASDPVKPDDEEIIRFNCTSEEEILLLCHNPYWTRVWIAQEILL